MSALPHLWEDRDDQALCLHVGGMLGAGEWCVHTESGCSAGSELVLGVLSYFFLAERQELLAFPLGAPTLMYRVWWLSSRLET